MNTPEEPVEPRLTSLSHGGGLWLQDRSGCPVGDPEGHRGDAHP